MGVPKTDWCLNVTTHSDHYVFYVWILRKKSHITNLLNKCVCYFFVLDILGQLSFFYCNWIFVLIDSIQKLNSQVNDSACHNRLSFLNFCDRSTMAPKTTSRR